MSHFKLQTCEVVNRVKAQAESSDLQFRKYVIHKMAHSTIAHVWFNLDYFVIDSLKQDFVSAI